MNEAGEDGHGDDAEVEKEGPVLEVVEIVFGALVNGGVAAPAVDLGPAGDADDSRPKRATWDNTETRSRR